MSKELTTNSLTAKNKAFISLILRGKKPVDAYHEAGYKGDEAAAYTLKHRLRQEIAHFINIKSTLDDTLLELDQLNEKELIQTQITMNQKLRIIALKLQALKQKDAQSNSSATKTFTAFVINRTGDKTTVQTNKVIDAEIVDETNQVNPSNSLTEQA